MKWNKLESKEQLQQLVDGSKEKTVMIFKHSTRCSISAMAISRLERAWKDEDNNQIEPYYLDLITYRELSNNIANTFHVLHESPQVLVIKDGKCVYHNSHSAINYQEIMEVA